MNALAKSAVKSVLAVTVISAVANSVYYAATAAMNHLSFTRPMPLIGLMLANHLAYALLMTYLYPRFARTGSNGEAAWFGTVMGALMFIPTGLVVRAAWEVPADFAFLSNMAFALASSAVMGLAVAACFRGRRGRVDFCKA